MKVCSTSAPDSGLHVGIVPGWTLGCYICCLQMPLAVVNTLSCAELHLSFFAVKTHENVYGTRESEQHAGFIVSDA